MKRTFGRVVVPVMIAACAGVLAFGSRPQADQSAAKPVAAEIPQIVLDHVGATVYEPLSDQHKQMVVRLLERDPETPALSACFAPGTPNEVMAAFNSAIFGVQPRYNQGPRWNETAMDPGGGGQGNPTVLTYSFVPDGTPTPSGAGEPADPSDLFAYLNGIYGTPAAWQVQYHAIFARWGELCGVTYVHEPNDDGASIGSGSPGVVGVRGDLRMAGHFIDGASGILAFNYYPQTGDMVIDTGDTFYTNLASNSLRLRNVLAHEHGHGMGQPHVCPIHQTKLMEPFVSTAYDGPRHDDIRNAQRNYGDVNEPDNSAGAATALGSLTDGVPVTLGTPPLPEIVNGSTLSIDGDGEQDWFSFSVAGPRGVSVTVTPLGLNYEDTPQSCSGQTGSCCLGEFTDSAAIANLNVQVVASNGTTVLATGAVQPAGAIEALGPVGLPGAGTFYVRVFEGNSPAESQLYTLTIATVNTPLAITLPSGAPQLVAPGEATAFPVDIVPISQTVVAGSQQLFYRGAGGAFLSAPLTFNGGTSYTATLPGFGCSATPEFYVRAQGSGGAVVSNPANAPTGFYSAEVGVDVTIVAETFESDTGWTVGPTTATTGAWVRADPNGTAAQPEDDVTAAGAVCWFTGQGPAGGAVGDADVDGGLTTLVSPTFDLSALSDATVSYFRWYSTGAGAVPFQDTMRIDVSTNNGGTWSPWEVVGPGSAGDPNVTPGWRFVSATLSSRGVTPTSTMRFRFIAEDAPGGSVVEAALDEFSIGARTCTDPGGCGSADFDGDGDTGTDNDIEAFFACLGGNCCGTCGSADFDGDGDTGTDGDIEAFFRVLGGGTC